MSLVADRKALLAQMEAIVAQHAPRLKIKAILFGIRSASDGRRTWPQLYVAGMTDYDPESSAWTQIDEDSWLPDGRYLQLPGLATMDPKQWSAILDHCASLLTSCSDQLSTLLGNEDGRPVALGWDDGDVRTLFVAKR